MPARTASRSLRALAAAAACLALSLSAPQPGQAAEALGDTVHVIIDFAKIVTVERPVATVVIGNAGIADAALGDDKTIVLTGKSAGATNMILLDRFGEEIAHTMVRVASDTRHLTTVFRGAQRQTFSCAPTCEQVIAVGDESQAFSAASSQTQARQTFSGIRRGD